MQLSHIKDNIIFKNRSNILLPRKTHARLLMLLALVWYNIDQTLTSIYYRVDSLAKHKE